MVLVVDVKIGCSCAFLPDGGPGYFPSPLRKDSKNIRALLGQLIWILPLRLCSLTQFLFISRSNIGGSFIHLTPGPSLEWEHLLPVFRSFLVSLNLAHEVLAFSFPDVITLATSLLFAINSISVKIENRPQWIRARQVTTHSTSNSRCIDVVALVFLFLNPTGHMMGPGKGYVLSQLWHERNTGHKGSAPFVASSKQVSLPPVGSW